jgi:hypothetical protein
MVNFHYYVRDQSNCITIYWLLLVKEKTFYRIIAKLWLIRSELGWCLMIYIYIYMYGNLQGKVPLVSNDGIHQLHIFIFVLAIFHVLYCVITLALGRAKVRIIYIFIFIQINYLHNYSLFFPPPPKLIYNKGCLVPDETLEALGNRDKNSWVPVLPRLA